MKKLIIVILCLFICGCQRHISTDKISYFPPSPYETPIIQKFKVADSDEFIYIWRDDKNKYHVALNLSEIPSNVKTRFDNPYSYQYAFPSRDYWEEFPENPTILPYVLHIQ